MLCGAGAFAILINPNPLDQSVFVRPEKCLALVEFPFVSFNEVILRDLDTFDKSAQTGER